MELMSSACAYIQAGGPVMWPLMAVSLWLWSLVLYKTLWLLSARRERLDLIQARRLLEDDGAPPAAQGPRSAALGFFLSRRCGRLEADRRLWEVAVRHQAPQIWRHLTTINVLAAVAPLLGLLGTVIGMIDTFAVIQFHGTGNAQALAAGISQALITTQTGLLVAIPGLFASYTLRRQARKLQQGLYSFQRGLNLWLESRERKPCYA